MTALVCTATVTPTPASARDSSSSARMYETKSVPGAAVLLRDARAHQPELGELREDVAREAVLAIPLGRVRLDLRAREVAGERLHLFLLRRRLEVHAQDYIEGW